MSKHFKISCALILLGSLGLLYVYHRLAQRIKTVFPGLEKHTVAVLPSNDKEEVSFNEKTHEVSVVTATKTIKEYAKNPVVEIRKDGSVVVDRHLIGFENEPFMGAGLILDGPRFFLGDNMFHLSRFDVQTSVGIPFNNQVGFLRLYGGFGYNFWSHTSINVAVNPIAAAQKVPDVAIFLSTRF
jgi:hypothetical protein